MQPTDRHLANAIRALAMDAVESASSGHPGMPMGMADAATALFTRHLKFDASDPHWPDRDRFILSAGHGSMLIYALLYLTGYARPTIEDIVNTLLWPTMIVLVARGVRERLAASVPEPPADHQRDERERSDAGEP